jgi:hypothetical protein
MAHGGASGSERDDRFDLPGKLAFAQRAGCRDVIGSASEKQ